MSLREILALWESQNETELYKGKHTLLMRRSLQLAKSDLQDL